MKIKKLIVCLLFLQSCAFSMEKASFSSLPKEMNQEIINQMIQNSQTIDEAINQLKKIRLINKRMRALVSSKQTFQALQNRFNLPPNLVEKKLVVLFPTLAIADKQQFFLKLLVELQKIPGLQNQSLVKAKDSATIEPFGNDYLVVFPVGTFLIIAKLNRQGELDENFGQENAPHTFAFPDVSGGNLIIRPGIIIIPWKHRVDLRKFEWKIYVEGDSIIVIPLDEKTLNHISNRAVTMSLKGKIDSVGSL